MKLVVLALAGYATVLAAVWATCRAAAHSDRQPHRYPPLDQITSEDLWAELDRLEAER